jgi:hypothetical protein
MPGDPTRKAENDSAPFHKTSKAAARARLSPDEPAHKPGEEIEPAKGPAATDDDDISALGPSVTRFASSPPKRARRADEANPELAKEPGHPRDKKG